MMITKAKATSLLSFNRYMVEGEYRELVYLV